MKEKESEEFCDFDDPFDTSKLISLPGKAELKIIEQELNNVKITESPQEPLFKKLGINEVNEGLIKIFF